jgi:cytochrome c oxidase subunit 2
MAVPGQVSTVQIRFDETRSYGIICHEYCGAAHHTMEGQLQVVPPSEFSRSDLQNPEALDEYEKPAAADETNEEETE